MAKEKDVKTNEEKDEKKEKVANKNKHEVEIKIEGEEWKTALDKTFKKKQKTAQVDGFRKGKVPRDIFLKHFGKESLYLDAADMVVSSAYDKALEKSKLVPVVQPNVDIKEINEEAITFIFTIITKPEVKIKTYKGLKITREEAKVEKEEIDHEIEHILADYTEVVTKDGKIENGDIAVIDFEGFKDGVAFDGGKGENHSLEIGSGSFIPGFEEQLIGLKAEDEKDLDLTFPKEYHAEDLAGQKVVFHVKVNEVKQKVKREFDEEFFEDLAIDGVNSEKTLREHIENEIKSHKEADLENKYVDELLEKVGENVDVDIPEEMVNEEVERLFKRFERNMQRQGISLDLYYQFTKSKKEDLLNQLEPEAFKNVLYRLMLEEIMNLEKIEVSREEAEKEAEEIAKKYNITKEEFINEIGDIEMLQYELEMEKTIDKLKEFNK